MTNEVLIDWKNERLPVKDLIAKYPECGVTTRELGYLCRSGAVDGHKYTTGTWIVNELDFLRYLKYLAEKPTYIDVSDK